MIAANAAQIQVMLEKVSSIPGVDPVYNLGE